MSLGMQSTIFDVIAARQLAEDGLAIAGRDKQVLLASARQLAERLGRERGVITMDDVCRAMLADGIDFAKLGNAAGSVFRGGCWTKTGVWVNSERVSRHGAAIPQWRYTAKADVEMV